jgi:hypothetical protein
MSNDNVKDNNGDVFRKYHRSPAFPVDGHYAFDALTKDTAGLTKREYFAAMAMQALITGHPGHVHSQDQGASLAISWADALIKRLNNEQDTNL